jgi:glycosyltransferase involved in cell wall biosynthesis
MEKNKLKILMQPSDLQGVGFWRTIWPAQSIQTNFSDEIDVEVGVTTNFNDIEYLSKFDIIHFHRQFGDYEKFPELSKELRKRNVILIMDIDDYWEPAITHPLYEFVKNEKLSEKILNNIKNVDCVTTTTDIFKKYILKNNPNVKIIPNAVNMSQSMWKTEIQENKTGKCRISYIGGSSHLHDLLLLEDSMLKLNSSVELRDKYQIVMCGFDIRGTETGVFPDGTTKTIPITPEKSIWNQFERILTSNYSLIENKSYVDYLKKIKKDEFEGFELENYVRRWTLPLTQYGKHYDYCDVCLAPLEETEIIKSNKGTISRRIHIFNEVKSELKIIEAGMKKKAIIAQNFGIYKELLKNRETGLLVSDNKYGWYKAMRELILNPDLREELANNLHEFVKDKYELKNVTKERVDFYKKIIEEKKSGILDKYDKERFHLNNPQNWQNANKNKFPKKEK